MIDTDVQSPGLHVLFGMDVQTIGKTLNDYLYGRCGIEQAAQDVTAKLGPEVASGGRLYYSKGVREIAVQLMKPAEVG